jgi:hypothetical protein
MVLIVGALWPGIAASKIVTAKTAPTTIAARTSTRTAELRADMKTFSSSLLAESFL